MVSYRTDRVDTIRRFYIGLFPDTETVSSLRDGKSIIRVRLRELENLLSRRLRDVALRLCNGDGESCYSRFSLLKSQSRKTLGDLRITNESYSNLLQLTHNLLKGTIDMEVFLIMPTTPEGKAKLSKELAKFHAEQALKMVQKLPCSTEQKLELIDAVVEHLRSKQ